MRLDRAAFLLASVLILIYYGFYVSCNTTTHLQVERGHDPWVFRSVLDERPRMLSMALTPDFWIAYDAHNASLYKVWAGTVNFDGAVYTTAHGPQPQAEGDAYLVSKLSNPWRLMIEGKEVTPQVQFRGHTYEGSAAYLKYELITPSGEVITVTEQPEYIKDQHDKPGLERIFSLSGTPKDVEVILLVHLASIMSEADLLTSGKLAITEKHESVIPGTHLLELQGRLTLNPSGETDLTVYFHPEPTIPTSAEASEEAGPKGFQLIDRSDCKTCHNEQVKTVGPAYIDIAKRYKFTSFNVSKLALKVMNGGSGVWGAVAMTGHPDLQRSDAEEMVSYIMGLDGETLQKSSISTKTYPLITEDTPTNGKGLAISIYQSSTSLAGIPDPSEDPTPNYSGVVPAVHAMTEGDFGSFAEQFYVRFKGYIDIPRTTNYVFRLVSDDGSVLRIDGKEVIDHSGFHGPSPKDSELILSEGKHAISIDFMQGGGGAAISLQWAPYGADEFSVVSPNLFSYEEQDLKEYIPYAPPVTAKNFPGDSAALESVHPSFEVSTIRPESFQPKVGGLDFMDDGSLVVSTWDPDGSVYLLQNIQAETTDRIKVKRIAKGLAEPLGLKVVDDNIYVLQKQELTQLIDHDGDDIIDEYRTLCNGWQASANFHEFAFGLVYQDGYFYCTLATAINPGGASTQPQIQDRGRAIRISKETGAFEFIAQGLRTPNGIGIGPDNEIFIADNQGDWLPSSKILHLKEGAFYGSRSVDFPGTASLTEMQPVVWLPQDEIGNSPSQPAYLNVGPYQGQMIHGEVTHGGIKRTFVEKVAGQYQGCLFRFTQGLEGGVNRLTWGPDDALYIGEVGNPGNWGHYGKFKYGLQRMAYNGNSTFEMLAVRAKATGMEIEFTEPLQAGQGENASDYLVQQWWYEPTINYGGPKKDLENLEILSITLSNDRKKAFLELTGMKPGHVVYFRLSNQLTSASNQKLWTTEGWYTLNKIPES